MKAVALLTGRGNNTLSDKNIREVLGRPLMSYPAEFAKQSHKIQSFYVSSDDEKILSIGSSMGYKTIKRPIELSAPDSKHIDVIFHAMDYITKEEGEIDILIVIMANSATLKTSWIDQAIDMIVENEKISSVVPVYNDQDHHPYRAKKIGANGELELFVNLDDMDVSTNRQELEKCYFLCHNFWVLNVKNSLHCNNGQKPWTFLGNKIMPIIVEDCFDVHDLDDLKKTEKWLLQNMK